jgi:hypothetical protein
MSAPCILLHNVVSVATDVDVYHGVDGTADFATLRIFAVTMEGTAIETVLFFSDYKLARSYSEAIDAVNHRVHEPA